MESIFHVPRFKLIHMEDIVCISYTQLHCSLAITEFLFIKKKKIRIKDYFSLYFNKKKSKGVNWDVNAKLTKSPSHWTRFKVKAEFQAWEAM